MKFDLTNNSNMNILRELQKAEGIVPSDPFRISDVQSEVQQLRIQQLTNTIDELEKQNNELNESVREMYGKLELYLELFEAEIDYGTIKISAGRSQVDSFICDIRYLIMTYKPES